LSIREGPGGVSCDSWSEFCGHEEKVVVTVIDCDDLLVMDGITKELVSFRRISFAFPTDEWEPEIVI